MLATSCQEPSGINPQEEILADNLKDIEFAHDNLKLYAQSALTMQNESGFRAHLYAAVEEAFDGEKNVLFKTLMDDSKNPINARSLKENLQQLNSNALTAFNNTEGHNYYPQVYIPFYDELKSLGKLGKANPHIVIYTHDLPNSQYLTYVLDNQGNLKESKHVSEDFARENEVWVISLNERVDSEGEVSEAYRGSPSRTQGVAYPNARFNTIKIDSHKEEWVAGGSEVHIKRYLSFYRYDQYSSNQAVLQVTTEDAFNDGDGWRITEVKRKDVGKTLTVNWTYVGNWPNWYYNFSDGSSYHTDYFYYVVFENDPWPTGMRTASIPDLGLSGLYIPTNYRSADTYYKQSYIPESGANYWASTLGFHFTSEY